MKQNLKPNWNPLALFFMVLLFALCISGCDGGDTDVEEGPTWTSISYNNNIDNIAPGVSYFRNQYNDNGEVHEDIVYIAGNIPVVISVPHGGYYDPDNAIIPERDCTLNNCNRDTNSQEIARELENQIKAKTGGYAHIIYNKLDRSKLDANREAETAYNQSNNARGAAAWDDFQFFIDLAKSKATANFGKCLYIDLHGQRQTSSIIIGYHMTAGELDGSTIDADARSSSSFNILYEDYLNKSVGFDDLIRGENSFGSTLYSYYSSYKVLPSQEYPNPSIDPYYIGGDGSYNLNRHCVNLAFTTLVSGMQWELHGDNLGSAAARPQFCLSVANALNDFLIRYHYMD